MTGPLRRTLAPTALPTEAAGARTAPARLTISLRRSTRRDETVWLSWIGRCESVSRSAQNRVNVAKSLTEGVYEILRRKCLSVCLSVPEYISGTARQNLANFFYIHTFVAVARSSSGGVAI